MTTLNIPEWADLGSVVDEGLLADWQYQTNLLDRRYHYYSGQVFEEFLDKERSTDPDVPLFPAGINIIKVICTALADATFGEWESSPVVFEPPQTRDPNTSDINAIEIVSSIMEHSGVASSLWEAELDRQVYGAGVLRVSVDLPAPKHIKWSRVQRSSFMPVFDPTDPDRLLAAYTATRMSAEQARLRFGFDTKKETVIYLEEWSENDYSTYLDGQILEKGRANPYKIVPFVYIPRVRTLNWWGEALTDDLIPLQDEINMRIADMGDMAAHNAHPIKWGVNLPRGFDRDNFPVGSDRMWDLGRETGGVVPAVGIVEPGGKIATTIYEHINFLLRMARDHGQTPSIVYGDDDGGGQRSGDTLEIRLRPLIATVRRSRGYWTRALKKMLMITASIYAQKQFRDIERNAVLRMVHLMPSYFPVLPRNRQALVDEVVKLSTCDPPEISIETAQKILGRGTGEVERIRSMIKDEEIWLEPKSKRNKDSIPDRRASSVSRSESDRSSSEDSE